MKITRIVIIVFLLSIIMISKSFAGGIQYSERVGFDSKFPDNNVYVMYKDTKNIMWFGTMFGLIMFDGSNYTKFKYDPSDSNTISNDDVISIFEDSKGYLWFGTFYGGLNRYDRKTGIFTRYLKEYNFISDNTVWSICEDSKGVIWAGTENGLNKFENNKWTEVSYGNDSSISKRINCLAADNKDNLYIGTSGSGLIVTDSKRKQFLVFNGKDTNKNSLSGFYVRKIFIDNGDVYIGMIKRGGYFLKSGDISAGRFIFYNFLPDTLYKYNNEEKETSLTIFDMQKYNGDNILAGTSKGIFIFNKSDLTYSTVYSNTSGDEDQNFISVLPDGKEMFWTSNYNSGLYKMYFNRKNIFSEMTKDENGIALGSIRVLFEYENRLFAGGKSGIYEIKNDKAVYSELNRYLKIKDIHSACTDYYNNLWIGTSSCLIKIDTKNLKQDTLLSGQIITALASKDDSEIYAGTSNGIRLIDISTNKVLKEYKYNPQDSNSLSENFILSMHIDVNGNLWIGTYAGLNLLKKGTDNFIRYKKKINDMTSLMNNYVYSFLEYENKIFMGSGAGLSVYSGNHFTNYSNEDGLAGQSVYSIVKFRDKLWIGTNYNVSIYDPAENTFALVKSFDELLNPSASYSGKSNDIYFGTVKGIIKINAEYLAESKSENKFAFTGFEFLKDGKYSRIDLTSLSSVTIPYDATDIKIEYSDLNYSDPGSGRYYYTISDIDKGWIYNGSKSYLELKTLDRDEYLIKFKVVNNNGYSFESSNTLKINVLPPFYRTYYFYAVVLMAAALLIFFIHRIKLKNKIRRVLEIERIKEFEREKIRYETSRDYHDELGHKLTRISIYSRNLLNEIEEQKNNISKELNKIIETSQSLRESAGDLIWSMDPGEDTLYDLAIRIKDFAENLLQDTDIKFTVSGIKEEFKRYHLNMDEKRNLLLISKEAVNNSVKYSKADEVSIRFVIAENNFKLSISDNGCGFIPDEVKFGYGINSMKSRAEKIHSVFSINSQTDIGTTIELELKMKNILKEFSVN